MECSNAPCSKSLPRKQFCNREVCVTRRHNGKKFVAPHSSADGGTNYHGKATKECFCKLEGVSGAPPNTRQSRKSQEKVKHKKGYICTWNLLLHNLRLIYFCLFLISFAKGGDGGGGGRWEEKDCRLPPREKNADKFITVELLVHYGAAEFNLMQDKFVFLLRVPLTRFSFAFSVGVQRKNCSYLCFSCRCDSVYL